MGTTIYVGVSRFYLKTSSGVEIGVWMHGDISSLLWMISRII